MILLLSVMVLVAGAVVLFEVLDGRAPSTVVVSAGYVVAVFAMVAGLVRGGPRGYPFWFAFVAAYPALTPLVVQGVLGYPDISARQPDLLQRTGDLAVPVLLAALAALVLGLSVRPTSAPTAERRPHRRLARPSATILIVLVSGFVLFSAWLAEPGLPLGVIHSYTKILDSRIPGTNFAGGAWVVFVCLGVLAVQEPASSLRRAKLVRLLFYASLIVSIAWLLLHARRSEVAGLLPFLLFTSPGRIRARQVVIVLIPLVTALAVLGYIRQPGPRPEVNASRYVQLPGAPGNILVTWVGAYKMHVGGGQPFAPGTTYLGLLQNVPPRLLHLPRAPELKDYVATVFPSLRSAGQFYLGEPFANFGYPGLVVFLALLGLGASAAVRAVQRFKSGVSSNLLPALVGADFLVLVFRTLWYGLDALISGTIMAVLVAAAVWFFFELPAAPRLLRPPAHGPSSSGGPETPLGEEA